VLDCELIGNVSRERPREGLANAVHLGWIYGALIWIALLAKEKFICTPQKLCVQADVKAPASALHQ